MSENIRVSEVSDILRKQLEGINTNVQLDEIGKRRSGTYLRIAERRSQRIAGV